MLCKTQGHELEMGGGHVSLSDEGSSGQNQITWRRPRLEIPLQVFCRLNCNSGVRLPLQHRNPKTLAIESLAYDSGRALVRSGYGYPKGSPNTNSYRRNQALQLSIQCSPQHTSKRSSSEPHGATRQQAIAKTPAK
jgi:hypothetical protein